MSETNHGEQAGGSSAGAGSTPATGTGQAYVLFGISLCLVITVGTVVQLMSMRAGLVITEFALILLPAILFVHFKKLDIAEALGWRPVKPAVALLAVAVGATSWGVAAGMHELLRPLLGSPPEIPGFEVQTVGELAVMLLVGALLPGLCEETLFRGAIQGILIRKGPVTAVVISAALFAAYHVNPWILVPAFFLGVVFGTLVVRTGSTIPAILAHLANNAVAFTVTYLYRDQTDAAAHVLMALLAAAFLATLPMFWIATRRLEPRRPALAAVPAGLPRPLAWALGIVAVVAVGLAAAAVALVVALVDVYTMSSDALEPQVRRGDRLVTLDRSVAGELVTGDIVALDEDGETLLRRIRRIEGDRVWIDDAGVERELAGEQITGKVIHTIAAEEPADVSPSGP